MSRASRKLKRRTSHRPTLSLAMMVKNEAETLERCLELARPHVDEVVVIDTGSTDGTQDIARRYADVFEGIPWPGSFAEARNYTFERASGTFILVLDGDEYLPDPRHWKRIRSALRAPDLAAAQLQVRNLLAPGQIVAADRMWQERLFRNDPQIRYVGKVHHQVQESLLAYMHRTGRKLIRIEAEIIHTGYALSEDRMAEKYTARLPLLEAEYRNPRSDRHRAYYGYQLGVVLFVLKDYERAADIFSRLDYGQMSPENAFYSHLLAAQSALKIGNAPMALVHSNAMLTIDRAEPVAYYTTGLALLMARRFGDGLLMLLEAYNINRAGDRPIRFMLDPAELIRIQAKMCEKVGLKDFAASLRRLMDTEPDPETIVALIERAKLGIIQAETRAA